MTTPSGPVPAYPPPLSAYPPPSPDGIWTTLAQRAEQVPFNVVATAIFFLAILHTFAAPRFTRLAHRVQERHDEREHALGRVGHPSFPAEMLHFLGEVEVVFGLWAVVLAIVMTLRYGWDTLVHYVGETVNFTEPLFVVVIMALASTRPIVRFAEASLRKVARLGGSTPVAWWFTILTIGPLLGSFITEPGAMTISSLLLARQFYDLEPSTRLKYATLGLLFVNVSVGGVLTHFAAPPVLMVARVWNWDTPFMLTHFGWRAVAGILVSNLVYLLVFRKELLALTRRPPVPDVEPADLESSGGPLLPVPAWVTATHMLFMAWTVLTAHHPAMFVAGFLFFLGFAKATAPYQGRMDLRPPLLVGFFLGGLVVHGGLQAWWIAPVLASLSELPLYFGATILTAFNDNALITYLSTLAPSLTDGMKMAVVQGAVTGGGLTVIANAPNPAGQALLGRFFGQSVLPIGLALGALLPTLIVILAFRL